MTAPASPLVRFLRLLGKVQFTTFLLLAGVVIMTIGTVLESRGSREIAWSAIYGTAWFDLFLFLIGVNLVIAVINRIPIKRHQWPFVVTHFAIVLLLTGAWISRTYGYEGRMMIYEGSEENQIFLDASEVQIRWLAAGVVAESDALEASYPLPQTDFLAGRTLQAEEAGLPEIRIAEYVANGVLSAELREGSAGAPPGIEFELTNGRESVREWLIADDPQSGHKHVGPVELEFRRVGPGEDAGEAPGVMVVVSPRAGAEPVRIALPQQEGEEVPCGPGVIARVQEFFARARVVQGKLVESGAGELNPAAVVEIRADGRSELHTVFAKHPDFNSVSGRDPEKPLVAGVSAVVESHGAQAQIAVLLGPDDELRVQVSGAAGSSPPVPVTVGRFVSLTSLGLRLRVERLLENARMEYAVAPAPPGSDRGRPYVRLEAGFDGVRQSVLLQRGSGWRDSILPGGGKLAASFGPQLRTVPFAIALDEFEVINYPGSNRPAEYRSQVQVKPAAEDLPLRDEVISMNRPLDVVGFRLFQSSYRLGDAGRPDATVLSVSYDPGVPLVYFSFALLIAGIAWGLRGVRPKPEQAAGDDLERRRAELQARRSGPPGAAPVEESLATRRAGLRSLGLLLAVLFGLSPAGDGWAQPPAPGSTGDARLPVEATRGWAILADGRAKPLLTYANETALAVTGREHHDGLSSLEILWGYLLNPQVFNNRPYVRVDSLELKAELGLDASEKRFSFNVLLNHPAFQQLVQQAFQRQREDQELSRLDDGALEAYTKLDRIASLASGAALTIVPVDEEGGAWMALSQLAAASDPALLAVHQGFGRLGTAYAAGDAASFRSEADALTLALRAVNPSVYPSESALERELFYEDFNAFGKAWKLYLAGFLAILLLGFSERPWGYIAGAALVAAGFICQSVGLGTRWAIADRAPVSDMYESLVFMGWGAIAIGLVAEAFNRKRFMAMSAGLLGFVCLSFSENLPIDSGINPLVPVLAHTYWLSVHVMTVMLSYSAFAIAMVLGHVMIVIEIFQREKVSLLTSLSKLLYKTLQVGVLFLAGGIIFGAVWANESWGRYWGWDPKETWSLITFFVYLAIIHARFAGWLRHFGLAATAILGFLAVVMTYYGVNFILAAGMHAYGFSEGGQFWVAVYAVLEIAIVLAGYIRYGAVKKLPSAAAGGPQPTGA